MAEEPPPHEVVHQDEPAPKADAAVADYPAQYPPEVVHPPMSSRWGSVVETVLAIGDQRALYDRLYAELSLGDAATQYGEVLASADRSERNLVDASRLHRAARLEEESVRIEVLRGEEVLRSAAREELDREKLDGKRSKAPTIQDVEDRTVANWPDQVTAYRRRKDEIHAVVEVTERLESAWRSRSATLREMMARYAPTRMSE